MTTELTALYTIPAPQPPGPFPDPKPEYNPQPYPETEPETPAAVYILSTVLIVGLIALFIAAFYAFKQTQEPAQALFSAFLIEAGAIAESFALIKRKDLIAVIGLLVSVLVSGTYNYIQSERIGLNNGLTDQWQLITLALGPLFAFVFTALSTGKQLSDLEIAREKWKTAAADHARTQAEQHAAALAQWQHARNAYQAAAAEQHAAALAQWEQARQKWIESELHRRERREDRKDNRKLTGNLPTPIPQNLPETYPVLNGKNGNGYHPETPAPTPIYTDYRQIPPNERRKLAEMTTGEIRKTYRLAQPKTAYNWQQNARREFPQPQDSPHV